MVIVNLLSLTGAFGGTADADAVADTVLVPVLVGVRVLEMEDVVDVVRPLNSSVVSTHPFLVWLNMLIGSLLLPPDSTISPLSTSCARENPVLAVFGAKVPL
jgi:hypothetical protein